MARLAGGVPDCREYHTVVNTRSASWLAQRDARLRGPLRSQFVAEIRCESPIGGCGPSRAWIPLHSVKPVYEELQTELAQFLGPACTGQIELAGDRFTWRTHDGLGWYRPELQWRCASDAVQASATVSDPVMLPPQVLSFPRVVSQVRYAAPARCQFEHELAPCYYQPDQEEHYEKLRCEHGIDSGSNDGPWNNQVAGDAPILGRRYAGPNGCKEERLSWGKERTGGMEPLERFKRSRDRIFWVTCEKPCGGAAGGCRICANDPSTLFDWMD